MDKLAPPDIVSTPHYDPDERKFTIVRVQDVEPILDQNKAYRAEDQKSDWGRHIGSVPLIVIEQWLHEEWNKGNTNIKWGDEEFERLIWRKLYDPDNAYLRTDKKSPLAGWSAGLV